MAVLILGAAVAGWMYGAPRPEAGGDDTLPLASAPATSWAAGGGWAPAGVGGDPGTAELDEALGSPDEMGPPEALEEPAVDAGGPWWAEDARSRAAPSPGAEEPQPDDQEPQSPIVNHRVSPGETLWDIARAYGTDVPSISRSNQLSGELIRPGQVLVVPTTRGVVHPVGRGETLWDIGRLYGVSVDTIVRVNRLNDPDNLSPGDLLLIPGVDGPRLGRVVVGGRLQRVFLWPVRGRVSSGYGWRWGRLHEGIDIAVPSGTPVRAAAPGRVVFARWEGGYGYLVTVDHGNRVVTRYAHNSRLLVRVGEWVRRGQIIAYSGDTGNTTGPHLHFEIRYRQRPVNPLAYLR